MKDLTLAESKFIELFDIFSKSAYENAKLKGWWIDRHNLIAFAEEFGDERLAKFARIAVTGLSIALKHSELSEALEGLRHGNPPDDKIPEFTSEEAEYADVIIRLMDTAAERNLRLGQAIIVKMRMNAGRPYLHGGKLA